MAQATHRPRHTRAEYIALERWSNVKHEYLDGVIYARVSGTPRRGLETYPDVTVVCGRAELDAEDRNVVVNPIVVVEVTSPSTEEYDRGEKVDQYKRIPSLQEIVLVSHRERLVEVVRREEDGSWTRHEARAGGLAIITSLGCEISVDEVYRDPLAAV